MVDSDMGLRDYVVHKITGIQKCKLADHWPPEWNAAEGGFKVKNERVSPPEVSHQRSRSFR